MQTVSQNWIDNQNHALVSESFVEISLDLTDPDALKDASVEETEEMYVSNAAQIIDEVDNKLIPYSTLEQNLWVLDGKRELLPDENNVPLDKGSGYISNVISDENGEFKVTGDENVPSLSIVFSEVQERSIPGLTINWGEMYGEYPTEFQIIAWRGSRAVARATRVDNTDVETIVQMTIVNYDRISISITKWCLPHRRARIENIFLGVRKVFDKSDLFSFSHSQEIDPISASLPKTTISFSLDNTRHLFSPHNIKGLSQYLLERQEIKVKYGYKFDNEIEWIKGGTFYLTDWKHQENGNTADFSAKDLLENLTALFPQSIFYEEGRSLYDLATEVLTFANLPLQRDGSVRWVIDESLKDIITISPIFADSVANCLQIIANAGRCVIYVDRDDVIHIEPRNDGRKDYTISSTNSYSKPEISLDKPIKQITVKVYDYEVAETATTIATAGVRASQSDEPETTTIRLNYKTLSTGHYTYMSGSTSSYVSIDNVEYYGDYCNVTYTIKGKAKRYFYIKGFEVAQSTTQITIPVSNFGEEITIDNPLITSVEDANAIADWVKNYVTNRQNISFSWRADPRLDGLDVIENQGIYDTNNVIMTKVDYTYNGAFRGSGEGRVI